MKFLALPKQRVQNGFTLVELLIASAVFSVILIICTTALLQIGRVYYKGIVSSQTQEAARSIIDEISRAIQFKGGNFRPIALAGSGSPPSPSNYFCIDNQRYSFVLGKELLLSGQAVTQPNYETLHALVMDSGASCIGGQNIGGAGLLPGSKEMLVPDMRLAKLNVCEPGSTDLVRCPNPSSANSNIYQITVKVVYGHADVLCSPSVAGDCASTALSTSLANGDITCKSFRAGTQFCAVSELSTSVQKRVK